MKCEFGTVSAEQVKVTNSPGFPKSSLLIGLEWLEPSVIIISIIINENRWDFAEQAYVLQLFLFPFVGDSKRCEVFV